MQVLLSVGEKYSVDLWKLGDDTVTSNPDEAGRFQSLSVQDLEALSHETRDIWSKGSKHEVLRAFRIAWVALWPGGCGYSGAGRHIRGPAAQQKPPAS